MSTRDTGGTVTRLVAGTTVALPPVVAVGFDEGGCVESPGFLA
jgi:hypothetical protein